jgi:hypothetical protein
MPERTTFKTMKETDYILALMFGMPFDVTKQHHHSPRDVNKAVGTATTTIGG